MNQVNKTTKWLREQILNDVKKFVHQVHKINQANETFKVCINLTGNVNSLGLFIFVDGKNFKFKANEIYSWIHTIYLEPHHPSEILNEYHDQLIDIQVQISNLKVEMLSAYNAQKQNKAKQVKS